MKLKDIHHLHKSSTCPYGLGTWSGNDKNNALKLSFTTYLLARCTKLSLNLLFGWNYIILMAHQSCHDLQLNIKELNKVLSNILEWDLSDMSAVTWLR